jgi:hypothetical protein
MLHHAGKLEYFYTDICAVKGWPRLMRAIPHALQPSGLRRLLGRVPYGVPYGKISALTSLGWAYSKARARGEEPDQAAATNIAFGKKFCETILQKGFGRATATYTFNSAGLELMRAAKQAGLKVVMEQTSAPRAVELEILSEAAKHYPGWAQTVPSGPNIDAYIAREEAEWQYADLILCGSEFVCKGIARRGGPVDKCRVVPYGVDNRFQVERGPRKPGPLRVLTVGQVRLQKGSPVIWEAAGMVGEHARFRMVGAVAVPAEVLKQKPVNVELTGAVPRNEITEQYRWADVFLLPSLCEGSAAVAYEATMAGLPVICSENTGSIVEESVTGFIVPILDPVQVAKCLLSLARHQDILAGLTTAAQARAESVGISAYRRRLLAALKDLA